MLVALLVAFFEGEVWLLARFGVDFAVAVDFAVVPLGFAIDLLTVFAGILLVARVVAVLVDRLALL